MLTKTAPRRTTRKRSFLLFELLISFALIALCLLPMIKPHAAMRKKQLENLIAMQLEQVNQAAFCKFKEQLYNNEGPNWGQLKTGVEGILKKEFKVYTGKDNGALFTCKYQVTQIDSTTKKSSDRKGLVVEVVFTFIPKNIKNTFGPFYHTLYLEQQRGNST